MGKVRDFLNQDAWAAVDRINAPYLAFMLSHKLFLYVSPIALVAAIWLFLSKTLALLAIALWVAVTVYSCAVWLWQRRRQDDSKRR